MKIDFYTYEILYTVDDEKYKICAYDLHGNRVRFELSVNLCTHDELIDYIEAICNIFYNRPEKLKNNKFL